jgi:hypothetical protein
MVEQEAVNFEVVSSSLTPGAKSIYFTDYPVSIHATGFLSFKTTRFDIVYLLAYRVKRACSDESNH